MPNRVRINGKWVTFKPTDLIGSGGEAEVYRYGNNAVKLFHPPDIMQQLNPGIDARQLKHRHVEKLRKLQAFPQALPANVIAPQSILTEGRRLLGYVMALVRDTYDFRLLSKRSFREGSIDNATVGTLHINLQKTLDALHRRGIVVGDLNDNNVLFKGSSVYLIDADSLQFDCFACPVATEQFLDPRLYGLDLSRQAQFSPQTDYYAAAVLLLNSWLHVGPYGGRHPTWRTLLRRAQQRISIFSDTVQYPKAAVRYDILPDDILQYFSDTFEKDQRSPLPVQVIEALPWTRCACGLEHARSQCPCHQQNGAVKETTIVNQSVKVTTLFTTKGRIHCASVRGDQLHYLYSDNGAWYRENGELVTRGQQPAGMRFIMQGHASWIGKGEQLVKVESGAVVDRKRTALFANQPVFGLLAGKVVIIDGMLLMSDGRRLGRVLSGQTWFSTGDNFGFGYYQAGALSVFFLFDTKHGHIREVSLPLPPLLIRDIQCHFSHSHVLVMLDTEQNGVTRRYALMLRESDGAIEAVCQGKPEDDPLLEHMGSKALNGRMIITAADDGLALFTTAEGRFNQVKLFRETEPFIQPGADFMLGEQGSIYQVTTQSISRLYLLN